MEMRHRKGVALPIRLEGRITQAEMDRVQLALATGGVVRGPIRFIPDGAKITGFSGPGLIALVECIMAECMMSSKEEGSKLSLEDLNPDTKDDVEPVKDPAAGLADESLRK